MVRTETQIAKSTYAGIFCGITMIVFFLVSRFFGWPYLLKLHFVNIVFLVPAIIYTVYHLKQRQVAYPYLQGLGAGLSTSVKSGLLFGVFLVIFLRFIDPQFMESAQDNVPLGQYMNPLVVALVFFTEQVCAGFIISLIVMQGFKNH